jgi:hypothetical protein
MKPLGGMQRAPAFSFRLVSAAIASRGSRTRSSSCATPGTSSNGRDSTPSDVGRLPERDADQPGPDLCPAASGLPDLARQRSASPEARRDHRARPAVARRGSEGGRARAGARATRTRRRFGAARAGPIAVSSDSLGGAAEAPSADGFGSPVHPNSRRLVPKSSSHSSGCSELLNGWLAGG